MQVRATHRTRTLIVRLDRGDELPVALLDALHAAKAKAGWITGVGALEAAEIASFEHLPALDRVRRIEGPVEIVSFSGSIVASEGQLSTRLAATLTRESEVGPEVIVGRLLWASVLALEIHVTILDDAAPIVAGAEIATRAEIATPALDHSRETNGAQPPAPVAASAPTPATSTEPSFHMSPVRPVRAAPSDEPEIYPEPGDRVTHFQFGECVIVSSDGERIRLRQERDGRVREIALTMLRIEAPTVDASGGRHFELARKHGPPR